MGKEVPNIRGKYTVLCIRVKQKPFYKTRYESHKNPSTKLDRCIQAIPQMGKSSRFFLENHPKGQSCIQRYYWHVF